MKLKGGSAAPPKPPCLRPGSASNQFMQYCYIIPLVSFPSLKQTELYDFIHGLGAPDIRTRGFEVQVLPGHPDTDDEGSLVVCRGDTCFRPA